MIATMIAAVGIHNADPIYAATILVTLAILKSRLAVLVALVIVALTGLHCGAAMDPFRTLVRDPRLSAAVAAIIILGKLDRTAPITTAVRPLHVSGAVTAPT
jgi:hypothetical protein